MSYLEQHKETLIPEFRAAWAAARFKTRGTWEEVFGQGPQTDEIFMAWHFARYTNQVAQLGAAEYRLPMYVNGQWVPGRWLNGDQTHQGRHVRLVPGKFDIQRVKLYRYR